jgi:hypothetical protein
MKNVLRTCAVGVTAVLAAVLLTGFQSTNNTRFEEITVERINVVDKAGHNRLVISNDSRMPGPMQRGQLLAPNGGRTGMLFYNAEHRKRRADLQWAEGGWKSDRRRQPDIRSV